MSEFQVEHGMPRGTARVDDGFWMTPTGSRVVVQQRQKPRARSSVLIDAPSRDRPFEGKVVAIGPDVPEDRLAVGEQVLFSRFAGQEGVVPLGTDEVFVILEFDEVICVLDEDKLKAAEEALKAEESAAAARLSKERNGLLDSDQKNG